jgi:chemotaxis protein MotA
MAVKRPGGTRATRYDWTTMIGAPMAIALVLAGQALEGGSLGSILQGTAALIVFGGTLGAVLVSFPLEQVRQAWRAWRTVLTDRPPSADATINEIVRFATQARRQGMMSLEHALDGADPFLAKFLAHAVDGAKPQVLRDMMELEIVNREEQDEAPAKVYEAAGGYLPTLGILGAVLGLIQTMQHLDQPEQIGGGIAVAFVATVYGVGAANLICLPIATKLKVKARRTALHRELMMEGVLAIQEGLNPRLIDEKLRAFVVRSDAPARPAPARRRAA